MDEKDLIKSIVRVGTVTDTSGTMCRVKFQDAGITSGWLYVLQHVGGAVSISADGWHTHAVHDTYTGGGSSEGAGSHDHKKSSTGLWMPKINDTVLCLYLPVFNGDGFVLGGVS